MNVLLDHAAVILVQLCLHAPLIFAGLLLAMNPGKFVALLNNVAAQQHRPESIADSPGTHTGIRIFGLALAMLAALHLFRSVPLE